MGTPNLVLAKVDKIHADGIKAIAEARVGLFIGFPPTLRRFNVALLFSEGSIVELANRIILPVAGIADASGVGLYLGSRDYPIHATLEEAEPIEGEVPSQIIEFSDLSLPDFGICFSELIMDRGNFLLAVSEIPEIILELRRKIHEIFVGRGMRSLPIQDMLHITIARVTRGSPEAIKQFAGGVEELRREVKKKPVTLIPNSFFLGNVLEFLTSFSRAK